jgi:hypothetical protein
MYSIKTIIVSSIIIILLILIYRVWITSKHTRNITDKPSAIEQFSNVGIVFGNPLINRNGYNLEISNFGMDSNKLDLILNSDSDGLSTLTTSQSPEAVIKVKCPSTCYITAIRTKGLPNFQIHYSMDDVTYQTASSRNITNFINSSKLSAEILTVDNLLNINGEPLKALYIKIISNIAGKETSGIKAEIYGMAGNSKIADKLTMESGASLDVQLYDEKAVLITSGIYTSDPTNNEPFLLIRMPNNYDYLVNFITFKSNVSNFKIKYGHSQRNHIYTLPCNGSYNGSISENNTEYFYFARPTMMNYITFIPQSTINGLSSTNSNKVFNIFEIAVYGNLIDPTSDKRVYIESSKAGCSPSMEKFETVEHFAITDQYNSNTQLNSQDILNNIKTTQNLCQILEYQDQISNEKMKMERNKQYLLKLQQQSDEISQLEAQIKSLQDSRSTRIKNTDALTLARYQQQTGTEAKVADMVKQRLDNQDKLAINLNLSN